MPSAAHNLQLYAVHQSELLPLSVPDGARDVHEALVDAPPGIYSALRSYHGQRFVRLDAHLARCTRCLAEAGYAGDFDLPGLRKALDRAVRGHVGSGDVRVRFDLLEAPMQREGVSTRGLLAVGRHIGVPSQVLSEGAHLELAPRGLYRRSPRVKFTDWVAQRRVCHQQAPLAYEHLLLDDDGSLLEGTSSNFYAFKGNTLVTAGDGVLQGITRQIVLELAERRGLTIELRRMPFAELEECDEACISSSTREIVPVSRVAMKVIGSGKPGPLVSKLSADYRTFAEVNAARAIES